MAGRADRIRQRITEALQPRLVEVTDDSAQHAGHAGASAAGETHFTVRVLADSFSGQSRLQRSRIVNGLLAEEFANGLHAAALVLRAPEDEN